ncbi:MAG: hypothetical protein ABR886_02215 [Dehalococcoidales bacterium]|jgi:acetyl-CoA synthase
MNKIVEQKRSSALTDAGTDTFYACAICQSLAPCHACIITPEQTGICGNYNWHTARAVSEREPYGPFSPITKGEPLDAGRGQWRDVNEYFRKISYGRIKQVNLYSLMHAPPTACILSEAVTAVLPGCNGVMTVNRGYKGETPGGFTYGKLLEIVRGGEQTPGFIGHAVSAITQENFLKAEGGLLRLVWMPRKLKEEIGERITACARALGVPDLPAKIADETAGITEETVLPFLREKGHPALTMKPILE